MYSKTLSRDHEMLDGGGRGLLLLKALVNIASVMVLRSISNPLMRGWTKTDLYDEIVAGARLQSSKRYLRNENTTSLDMVGGRVLLR